MRRHCLSKCKSVIEYLVINFHYYYVCYYSIRYYSVHYYSVTMTEKNGPKLIKSTTTPINTGSVTLQGTSKL